MAVRAVLFDFYGTLAEATSWRPTYDDVFAAHGYEFRHEVAARWRDDAFDGQEHAEHSRSRDDYLAWVRERRRGIALDHGVGPDDVDALLADLDGVGREFTMRAYDEVPDVLAGLRARGIKVVVCSNWDWDLDRAIDAAGIADLLDVVVTSAQAGARKPHPHIFRHTLDRAGVEAREALFVGDSWGPDVEGPLAAGIRAVHVWREDVPWIRDRPAPPPVPEGVVRLPDLRDVPALVSSPSPPPSPPSTLPRSPAT